jgi:hypothetical protein
MMRAATRSKRLGQSQRFLVGSSGTARAYGVGEIGPDPRRTLFFILCGVVVIAFLMFIVYAVVVVPGVLLIWAIYMAIERSTSVVATDQGVALLARSEFNGRPRKFITLLPAAALTERTIVRSGRYVHVPAYRLWLRQKEFDYLRSSLAEPSQSAPGAMRPGPAPRQEYSRAFIESLPPPPDVRSPSPPSSPPPGSVGRRMPESEPGESYWARRTGQSSTDAPVPDDPV